MTCTEKAEQTLQRCLMADGLEPLAWQSAALGAYSTLGGVFLAMPPGSGKSAVMASVCLREPGNCVVVMPAAARAALTAMFQRYGVTNATFLSYTQVSRDATLLEKLRPRVLLVDESQALKNVKDSAWGRRIARYISDEPACRVVCSSGSVMHRSALDYMPQLVWALRARAPCPGTWSGMQRAARDAAENPEAWLAKLRATPGVFIESAPSWDGELVIREHTLPVSDDSAYAAAAASGMAPDGWACEGFALAELLRQLSWGWYYARNPRPSPRLVEVRAQWARCVTQAKAFGLCDTAGEARAHYPDAWRAYEAALEAEPCGAPVATWAAPFSWPPLGYENGTIIWVNHPPLAERIARELDLPYHHEGALDARGVRLDETDAPVVVASIRACSASLNCQARFSHNIVLEPPADARVFQQLLCRTARQGQLARTVTCDIVLASPTYVDDLATAKKLAAQIERETGQRQLLLTKQRNES